MPESSSYRRGSCFHRIYHPIYRQASTSKWSIVLARQWLVNTFLVSVYWYKESVDRDTHRCQVFAHSVFQHLLLVLTRITSQNFSWQNHQVSILHGRLVLLLHSGATANIGTVLLTGTSFLGKRNRKELKNCSRVFRKELPKRYGAER